MSFDGYFSLGEWSCGVVTGSSFTCEYLPVLGSLQDASTLYVPFSGGSGVPPVLTASGGGGVMTSSSAPTSSLLPGPVSFEMEDPFSFPADGNGVLDTQAGAHPNSVTVGFSFSSQSPVGEEAKEVQPDLNSVAVQDVRDVVADLPTGFSGDPQAAPKCPLYALSKSATASACPAASRIGTLEIGGRGGYDQEVFHNLAGSERLSVFNMMPERGHPAEFGAIYLGYTVLMYPSLVGSGAQAHLRVTLPGVPFQIYVKFEGAQLTFYGDPVQQDASGNTPVSFLRNPTSCLGEPLTTSFYGDSYETQGARNPDGSPDLSDPAWVRTSTSTPATTGCGLLHFGPTLGVRPESTQADSPTGASVDVGVPQNPSTTGLATPDLRSVSLALPAGMAISPPAADGLQACTDAQFDVSVDERSSCPGASQVGTVRAHTPLLTEPLEGELFVGQPECSPCTPGDAQDGRMVRLFMQLEGSGIVLKFPGTVSLNPTTGQLTATFRELTQQPVSDIQIQMKGGPRAPLATPQACGPATTTSDLMPWSAPQTPDATPTTSFTVDWDGQGGACPSGMPFSPGFAGGTVTPLAGAFSPLTVTFSRKDREQGLSAVTVNTPPGLLGVLKDVPLCGEPQAAQGTCPSASRIGVTHVAVGPGSHPFWQEGQVYLTGPYKGQPFGLSVVVPAVAGPFNLGVVVVRASIHINPATAALSVSSDPFPTSIDGVPLRVQTVNVTIDRPGFTFNPTDCNAQQLTASIASTQGASANVSTPFGVGGCQGLAFHPSFTASTQAATSKKSGASLVVKTSYPAESANIASVAVTLPVQLPARFTTIQQACTEQTFNANPAKCPTGSDIGTGTAVTPILANPLTGPVYLVSHGGAAFPDVVVILQGEGVTVDLTGSIDIKHDITSSTFASVPDAPISAFTLALPEGPHSGLAAVVPAKAKGSLCGQSLTMPTTITGQNGAVVKQTTKIAVTGCPRAKKKKAAKRAKKKRK
jgi:hypothetical protein